MGSWKPDVGSQADRGKGLRRGLGAVALCAVACVLMGIVALAPLPMRRAVAFPAPDPEARLVAVFVGESRCGAVCPQALAVLRTVSRDFDAVPDHPTFGVVFVELSPAEAATNSEEWVRAFHDDFRVLRADEPETAELLSALGIQRRTSTDSRLSEAHRSWIYLLRREDHGWELRGVHRRQPPDADSLLAQLESLS